MKIQYLVAPLGPLHGMLVWRSTPVENHFSTLCAKKVSINLLAQKLLIECWGNWHLESISPMFYKQYLGSQTPKVQKDTDDLTVFALLDSARDKAFHRMLVKLTSVVHFINIIWAVFALRFFRQKNSKPNCNLRKALKSTFVQKSRSHNVDEIEPEEIGSARQLFIKCKWNWNFPSSNHTERMGLSIL